MNIIVFFNGWGVNESILDKISPLPNYEVKYVSFPYDFDKSILNDYEEIIFVGWSFGSYYLSLFLNKNLHIKPNKIIGINGNSKIIGKFGIAKKILGLTVSGMNKENLKEFYKNMGCSYLSLTEGLDINKLTYELTYIFNNFKDIDNVFTKLIISNDDRIVKTKNQLTYSKENNIETKIIEGGHYPFDILSSWEKIIN